MQPRIHSLFVAAVLFVYGSWAPGQNLQVAREGDVVPDFTFGKIAVVDDASLSMKQWRGQPVLFEFWGTR